MNTKSLTFLLALTFLFVFSGSVFGQEEVKNEYGENKKSKSEIHFKNEKKDTLKTTSNDGGQKLFRGDLAGAWEYLLGFAAFVIAIQLLILVGRYYGIAMIASFMGHASLDMLLKRYGHFTDETRRKAVLKFDQRYTNGTQAQ